MLAQFSVNKIHFNVNTFQCYIIIQCNVNINNS